MKHFVSLLFLTLSIITATAQNIKIAKGNVDTVYTSKHIVIGITNCNYKIFVNGEESHVYKTGAFGKEITLNAGDNNIIIKAIEGDKEIESTTLKIFYNTNKKDIKTTAAKEDNFTAINGVATTLENAYLNYGAGTDRLGGAKINFIDKGIELNVVAQNSNLYMVRLSANRYAYIPKSVVNFKENILTTASVTTSTKKRKKKIEPISEPMPIKEESNWEYIAKNSILSTSSSVSAQKGVDRVLIGLPAKRPYIIKEYSNPNKIVVDLYGVQCNSNWITHYKGLKVVDNLDVESIDSDITRFTIYLKSGSLWGFNAEYRGTNLVIDVKHAPALTLKGMVIGVDAGHGGENSSGAVSITGHKEKVQNLSMAYILKELLEKEGAKVVLTRSDDSDLSMTKRKEILKENNVNLLISIHCNAGGNPLTTGGTSTYYRYNIYKDLADSILSKLLEIEGVKNFGMVGNFNFSLNAPTAYPSVLVETLFMSNLWDEEHIIEPAFQREMMIKVVEGLKEYLKKAAEYNR